MSEAKIVSAEPQDEPGKKKRDPWWKRLKRRIRRYIYQNAVTFYALSLGVLAVVIVLAPRIFVTIPAGHVGVLWLRFFGGTVVDQSYSEGVHVIFPWDEMVIYDARLQNSARVFDTISSNGLGMQVQIATRYRINRDAVGMLHKLVGPHYDEVLVYPEIGSHARELISRYTPEELYSETRGFIQAQILERMVTQLGSSLVNQSVRGKLVDVEDVLIRSVTLPPRVQEAIQRKAEQYQAMLEYDFRIAREAKERDRKRIEAEGVRDFQTIVSKSITDEYLRLRGIEATMALSNSKNSKIIIIGGKNGLPVILNTADTPQAALPQADVGTGTSASTSNAANAATQDVATPNAALSSSIDDMGTVSHDLPQTPSGAVPTTMPEAATQAEPADQGENLGLAQSAPAEDQNGVQPQAPQGPLDPATGETAPSGGEADGSLLGKLQSLVK